MFRKSFFNHLEYLAAILDDLSIQTSSCARLQLCTCSGQEPWQLCFNCSSAGLGDSTLSYSALRVWPKEWAVVFIQIDPLWPNNLNSGWTATTWRPWDNKCYDYTPPGSQRKRRDGWRKGQLQEGSGRSGWTSGCTAAVFVVCRLKFLAGGYVQAGSSFYFFLLSFPSFRSLLIERDSSTVLF